MPVPTPKRRIRALLAAAAVTAVLATGCTAGDWNYDAPPAAGTQIDAGPVKARNFILVSDGEGRAALLGSFTVSETVSLDQAAIAPEDADGVQGEPTPLDLTGEIKRDNTMQLDASNALIEGVDLVPGRLANLAFKFSDGTTLVIRVPVVTTEQPDFATVFDGV